MPHAREEHRSECAAKVAGTSPPQEFCVSDPSPADRRARFAAALLAAVMGTANGAWAARIPDVRAQARAGDAAWGLVNTIGAGVNLAAMTVVVAVLVGRVAPRKLAVIGAVGVLLVTPAVASARNLVELTLGLCAWFCVSCALGVPMGALQLEVQRRYGRPLMGSFGASFGISVFVGGGIGTAAAALDVPVARQFLATSTVLVALVAVTSRWLPAESADPSGKSGKRRVRDRFTRQLVIIAGLAGITQYVTTTNELWTASYTVRTLGVSRAAGAATYTAATVASIVTLLLADRASARVGHVPMVRGGALLAAGGIGLVVAGDTFAVVVAGFLAVAVGMACTGPSLQSFAGKQTDVSYSEAMSVYESGDGVGAFVAPSLIGMLASTIGLRASLATVAVAAATMACGARAASGVRQIRAQVPRRPNV